MNNKGKELYDEVMVKTSKIQEVDSLERKFTDFWKLACLAKNTNCDIPMKYDDSTQEFIDKHREQLSEMRDKVVKNLDFYVEKCIEMLKKNKFKVYYAKSNEEAHEIFLKEVGDVKTVYKSKSNEAKDIGLIDLMKDNNITIKETDLGDVLVQLFDYKLPTYQVGPGIHFDVRDITAKIKEKYGVELENKQSAIVQYYRDTYRKELLNDVKVSLTSANSISAEDGCVVLLENEGNISLLTRATEKHIVAVGITKIVPSVFDAVLITKMIERSNGADLAYISLIYGPSGTSDIQAIPVKGMYGAKEVVVILVDDWRTRAANENLFYLDYLKCISCKTCSFVCPASAAYGNTFASYYGLGATAIIRDYIHHGIEAAVKDGLFLCTGCENCSRWCPTDIDLANMMKNLKKEATEKGFCPPPIKEYQEKILKDKNPFK